MTSVVDVWRAVDPDATLVSGSPGRLGQAVRGVARTRAAPPHLPDVIEAGLLVADATLVAPLDALILALHEADLRPVAIVLAGLRRAPTDGSDDPIPVLVSTRPAAGLADEVAAYVADETRWLERLAAQLRLLCAEAALADPEVGTPAGLVAGRVRRGVAVSADGELKSLHARTAGRALAARFTAMHARLLAGGAQRSGELRSRRGGLWLLERRIRPGASVWLFDDLPFAAVDEVAADALAVTLRALMRRPSAPPAAPPAPAAVPPQAPADGQGDPLRMTLLAVARHNGRIAPAARSLGVHRNTVLYRLRRGQAELGLDPRRPADALRLLAEAEAADGG